MKPLTYYKMRLFPYLVRSKEYCSYLRKMGISVGKKAVVFEPSTVFIDVGRPELLKIGDYCKITKGVTILTHDYSRSVLRRVYGEVLGDGGRVVIGDNVFIGMNATVLMGTQIGNNVVIGAGSVVSGYIPDNVVVAGNPAKVIETLDEYYAKRKKKSLEEAQEYALLFKQKNGRYPEKGEMGAWFPLFLERDKGQLIQNHIFTRLSGDEEEEVISFFLQSSPMFESYEDFIDYCEKKGN